MMDSRAAFEAWIRGTKCSAVRLTIIDNEYVSEPVQFAWEGWCAATERAAKVQADPLPADAVKRIKDKCSALGLDDVAFAWHIQKHLAAAIRGQSQT